MSIFEIIGGVLIVLICIGIVIMVLFQESPKGSGVSALTGGDSYYNKNQGRTRDAFFGRVTKWLAVGFFVLAIAATVVPRFL